jgi:hypothetical protein
LFEKKLKLILIMFLNSEISVDKFKKALNDIFVKAKIVLCKSSILLTLLTRIYVVELIVI